jgi:hypothetical protein
MTDEIKAGQKWKNNGSSRSALEVRFVDDDGSVFVRWNDSSSSVMTPNGLRRYHTLIPNTVLVELSVEDAKDLRGSLCVEINGTNGAHNRLYTACAKALDEREGK